MIAGFLLSLVGRFPLPSKLISGIQLLMKFAAKVFTVTKAFFNFSTQMLRLFNPAARKASRKCPRHLGLLFLLIDSCCKYFERFTSLHLTDWGGGSSHFSMKVGIKFQQLLDLDILLRLGSHDHLEIAI